MKRVLSAVLMIALATSLFVSCGGGAQGAEFIMNNGAEPATLDPSNISGVPEHHIYMALFDGLVTYDPKTSLAAPGVAESWSTSADGLTVTFKLRKSTWSDGTPITAQTVVDSWLRTLHPDTAAEYAYMVNMVVKGAEAYNTGKGSAADVAIRALDDYTFQVDLLGPMPYAVDMMAHYAFAILPMHVIAEKGTEWIKPENMVSNGAFVLQEWKPQESLTVVKNTKYWDAKNVKLSKITFLPIEDQLTAYNKFKAGEIDWASGVPLDLIDEVKLRPDYQGNPQVATYYYIFNMTREPFTDVRVRKALTMALDMQELVDKVLKGGQIPANGLVPAMAGYTPVDGNPFNPEEAKRLLADAGYPNGKGFPETTLLYNTNEGHKKIAEWAQESWKQNLGITTISLDNKEWGTFLDIRQNLHDFDFCRAGWVGDYLDPNTFLDMFLANSGLNDGLYNSPAYDELVRLAATQSGAERMESLRQAETIMITDDQHVIPFYHYVNQDLIDLSKWDGWYPNPLGSHPWKYIAPKE
ncbi:MAG: peptide ABC transporter substrate-binding protein [Spirochaetia bacterium]|nr:peptide ABC transporter substrate-binding protein [Spirochaetia bacterium]